MIKQLNFVYFIQLSTEMRPNIILYYRHLYYNYCQFHLVYVN